MHTYLICGIPSVLTIVTLPYNVKFLNFQCLNVDLTLSIVLSKVYLPCKIALYVKYIHKILIHSLVRLIHLYGTDGAGSPLFGPSQAISDFSLLS